MDKITIRCPDNYLQERKWICTTLLSRFCSSIECIFEKRNNWQLEIAGSKKTIQLPDTIIPAIYKDPYLIFLPPSEISIKDAGPEITSLFCIHAIQGNLRVDCKEKVLLNADVFGMAFWALSRWEEVYLTAKLDSFGRFMGCESYLYKNNLLGRPWIDEWVLYIRKLILKIWPQFLLKQWKYKLVLTHDIDVPFRYANLKLNKLPKKILADIYHKKSLTPIFLTPFRWLKIKNGNYSIDPYYNFKWILDELKKSQIKSVFYFQSNKSHHIYDGDYSIDDFRIKNLLKSVSQSGHTIGLHPSYESYTRVDYISEEKKRLADSCNEALGYEYTIKKSRQHFLRWDSSLTPICLELAGIEEDSSLGFSDQPGFRAGTCWSYHWFDLVSKKSLNLIESPLVIMDQTLFSKTYLHLERENAFSLILQLKKACERVGGNCTILWHNNNIVSALDRELYKGLLSL